MQFDAAWHQIISKMLPGCQGPVPRWLDLSITFSMNDHFTPLPVVIAKLEPFAACPPPGAGSGSRFNLDRAHKD